MFSLFKKKKSNETTDLKNNLNNFNNSFTNKVELKNTI